jgi:hypothetical protein
MTERPTEMGHGSSGRSVIAPNFELRKPSYRKIEVHLGTFPQISTVSREQPETLKKASTASSKVANEICKHWLRTTHNLARRAVD